MPHAFAATALALDNVALPGTALQSSNCAVFTISLWDAGSQVGSASYDERHEPVPDVSLASIGRFGDMVRVQLDCTHWLHMAEVQPDAAPVAEPEGGTLMLAGLATVGPMARCGS